MLYIKGNESDLNFFKSLENRYDDILVTYSRNFDGSAKIVEVFIELTPVILSSLTVILTEILSYMKSKHTDNSTKITEIQIESNSESDEYKVLVKSSEVDNIEAILDRVMQHIHNNENSESTNQKNGIIKED